jgi:hypothetical protein
LFDRHTVQAKTFLEEKTPAARHMRRGFSASIDAPSSQLSLGKVASTAEPCLCFTDQLQS